MRPLRNPHAEHHDRFAETMGFTMDLHDDILSSGWEPTASMSKTSDDDHEYERHQTRNRTEVHIRPTHLAAHESIDRGDLSVSQNGVLEALPTRIPRYSRIRSISAAQQRRPRKSCTTTPPLISSSTTTHQHSPIETGLECKPGRRCRSERWKWYTIQ